MVLFIDKSRKEGYLRMFKIIGGVLVYGFALYGLSTFLSKNDWVEADND